MIGQFVILKTSEILGKSIRTRAYAWFGVFCCLLTLWLSWPSHPELSDAVVLRSNDIPRTMLADLENPCGPVCLSLISHICGHPVSLDKASELVCPDSLGRTSVGELVKAINEAGLHASALRLPLKRFSKLNIPTILHWGSSHFVVAITNEAGKVMLLDPPLEPDVTNQERLVGLYSGVAILVAVDQEGLDKQLLEFGL